MVYDDMFYSRKYTSEIIPQMKQVFVLRKISPCTSVAANNSLTSSLGARAFFRKHLNKNC